MAEKFDSIDSAAQKFIEAQPLFFVATAGADGQVNISPKGQDSLRVLGPNEVLWLNLTGSGNETAAHLGQVNRMTLMWCAFTGPPNIMRAYGGAEVIHPRDAGWADCTKLIEPVLGARQYIRLTVDLLQTSCGYAVPFMDFREDRVALTKWNENKGEAGIEDYWRAKNQLSIDGRPTGIV
jgi:predicted pyridoxine 5'-phosphate oxidase superfamily flavin-nucleotide-binding protein